MRIYHFIKDEQYGSHLSYPTSEYKNIKIYIDVMQTIYRYIICYFRHTAKRLSSCHKLLVKTIIP